MTTKKRRRVALNFHGAQVARVGKFLVPAGRCMSCAAIGKAMADMQPKYAAQAADEWGCMDGVARAAVGRLGLVPMLTALGCIPQEAP